MPEVGVYWEHFSHTVPGLLLFGAAMLCTYLVSAVDLVRALTVKGSRIRYMTVSILKVLVLPAIVLLGTQLLINAATAQWLLVAMDSFLIAMYLFIRVQIKDEDSWWTGRGTRAKKALKSFVESHRTGRTAAVSAA